MFVPCLFVFLFSSVNFLIPLTPMLDTNSMYIESKPGEGDFKPLVLQPGQLLRFNGNKCVHGNEPNQQGVTRLSIDFRMITVKDFDKAESFPDAVWELKPPLGRHDALVDVILDRIAGPAADPATS